MVVFYILSLSLSVSVSNREEVVLSSQSNCVLFFGFFLSLVGFCFLKKRKDMSVLLCQSKKEIEKEMCACVKVGRGYLFAC